MWMEVLQSFERSSNCSSLNNNSTWIHEVAMEIEAWKGHWSFLHVNEVEIKAQKAHWSPYICL
jgi:hypothetical protein